MVGIEVGIGWGRQGAPGKREAGLRLQWQEQQGAKRFRMGYIHTGALADQTCWWLIYGV